MEYRTYHLAELLPEALERLTGRRTPEASLPHGEEPARLPVPPRSPKGALPPPRRTEKGRDLGGERRG